MKNITIIIPVHKIDDIYGEMLKNAITSVENFHNDVEVLIVAPTSIKKDLKDLSQKLDITIVENKGETDFCSQVNLGIEKCKTEWFSILEMDDEYKPIWLKSMNEYILENPDVDVFFPIVKDVNVKGKFLNLFLLM